MTDLNLHKLKEFSCEVQENGETNNTNCVLNFKVDGHKPGEEVTMIMNKSNLDVLLDGLRKIQTQLTNVAAKSKTQN